MGRQHRLRGPDRKSQQIPGLGTDLPDLRQARALWQLNRFDEALQLFEQTARRYPQNLVALIDGSRALGARFEIHRAEVLLDRLLALAPRRPEVLHLAGQSYRMIFRPDRAMECFQQVLRLTRTIPDAYLELAVLYDRRHRVAEALALLDQCLDSEPGYAEAELLKARLLRRLGHPSESETLLRDLSERPSAHVLVRAQAWGELAQTYDRHDQYELAMEAMLQCKELVRPHEGALMHEALTVMSQLRTLAESLTAEEFRNWAKQAESLAPQKVAVLSSFPRSGTTLLEQVLDAHSGLVSSDEREAFARDIFPALWMSPSTPIPTPESFDRIPPERLAALRCRYLDYMAAALNQPLQNRVHLDKNPTLTLVLPGFLRLFPEARLLIALRDPRDVVISCFFQYLPLNANSVCFLTLERTAERYAHDMAVWGKLREKIASPWMEIRYENAVANLEGEARRALQFLELPWESGVMQYRDRLREKAVGSPTYEAVAQPLYTRAIGRWHHYEKYLVPHLHTLGPSIDAFGY